MNQEHASDVKGWEVLIQEHAFKGLAARQMLSVVLIHTLTFPGTISMPFALTLPAHGSPRACPLPWLLFPPLGCCFQPPQQLLQVVD